MSEEEARQKLDGLISELEAKKTELNEVSDFVNKIKVQIEAAVSDITNKLSSATSLEADIIQKQTNIGQILSETQTKQNEINSTRDTTSQSVAKIEEFKTQIEDLVTKADNIQKKSQEIEDQIETELKSGTTSINLSKSFADKVIEYHQNARFWSQLFVVFTSITIIYYGYITFNVDKSYTLQQVWLDLLYRLPFLIFLVWLAIFFGNRRAESKKLEESYKHKEVMARSFVGYKKVLEDLGDQDKDLLKQHMSNLLAVICKDSGDFLETEGDKHPAWNILNSWFGKSRL